MRSKLVMVVSVAATAIVLAACGSSKSSSTTTGSSSTSTTSTTAKHQSKKSKKHAAATGVPSRTYSVKLAGKNEVPKGAPSGIGNAVVTIHGKTTEVCWRFSHLHGFTSATFAHVHQGATGKAGNIVVPLSTGSALKHAGCVKASTTLMKAIEANPHGYYVNIHSKKYPGGAVRAQL